MENNNTPRKARIYYESESIPVLVENEYDRNYELVLDWDTLTWETHTFEETNRKRNLYLDALFGWEGAHEIHNHVSAIRTPLALYKNNPEVVLVFGEREHKEVQDNSIADTGIDNVVPFPKVAALTELEQHLALLGRSGYRVKSFDVSIQEGGQAHLCATFTKEVDN